MGLSTDVTLAKSIRPLFPDKCIVCHAKPDSTIRIVQNSQNPILSFFLPILMLFGWSTVEIPICKSCKFRFRIQRWGRNVVCMLLVILLIWLLMPYFSSWPRGVKRLVVCALALLGLTPYIFAEVLWPRIFDTTARKDEVDYEFSSPEYAAEFAELNSLKPKRASHGPGLSTSLIAEGWQTYRFGSTLFAILLPDDFAVRFDDDGVLIGSCDGKTHNFTATLHIKDAYTIDPARSYITLNQMAEKYYAVPRSKGTYRYFMDTKTKGDSQLEYRSYVIAIPGAVVVLSLASSPGMQRPAVLERIEHAIPDLLGEINL